MPTRVSRLLRYLVMENTTGVRSLANTYLGLAIKATNYLLLRSQVPPIIRPLSLCVVINIIHLMSF